MATCSSILAWKILWTEKRDGLQNMASRTQLSTHQPFMTAPVSEACFIREVACNLGWAQTLSPCPEPDNVHSESWMSGFHHLKAFLSLEFYSIVPTIPLFSGTLNLNKFLFYLTFLVGLGRSIGLLALIPVQKSWLGLLHKLNKYHSSFFFFSTSTWELLSDFLDTYQVTFTQGFSAYKWRLTKFYFKGRKIHTS